MPTWKKVVVSGSAISQLNNDANYLATLGDNVVSSSAQIATDISGSFVSASNALGTRIDNVASTITLAADNGSNDTYTTGETLTFTGDNSISTTVSDNEITIALADGVVSSSAQVVSLVESGTDSNTFTDADHSKLNAIEAAADVTDTTNVTAAGALMDSELTDLAGVKGVTISTLQPKPSEGAFADGDKTKLDAIEASADVTDATNVTAAGALMDSELTSIADVKALNQSVVSGATPTFTTTNFTDATNKRLMTDAQETKLDTVETSADVTDTANVTAAGAVMDSELTNEAAVKAINQGLATSDNVTFANTTVTGNLTVSGTTTTVNSETLNIDDNIIALNGNGAALGGIAVNDGPATGSLLWDGDNDRWVAGATGSESAVLTALGYGILSGSTQIAADISGSFVSASNALGNRIDNVASTITLSADVGSNDTYTTGETLTFEGDNSITTTVSDNKISFAIGDGIVSSSAQAVALVEAGTDSNTFTDADHSKLNAIEASATADQTDAEIRAAVEAATDSNVFTDADHSKLNAIEASADVTDATNVTAAGALMDSELTSIADVKALDQSVVSGATPTFTTTNFTDASDKRLMTDAQETKLDSVESSADVTDTANVTAAGALMDSELTSITDVKALNQSVVSGATPTFTTTNFTDATNKRLMTDAQETKLDSVESSADVTDTANVTAAGALMDSELTNLAAVKAINQGLATSDNVTFANTTVTGNLTISGTTTTVNSETLNIDDNIIALNGNGAALGGIAVNDGPATGSLLWNGTDNRWVAGATGSESAVITALGYGVLSGSAQIAADISGSFVSASNALGTRIDNVASTITLAADAGSNDTYTTGETLTFEGDNSITTTVSDNKISFTIGDGIMSSSAQIVSAVEAGTDSNTFTDADHSKLNAIEASATADQTDAEIRAAVEAATDSNVFTDADHSKLNAIEASADVTDATNVTAAGAVMDSEVTNLAFVKGLTGGISDGNVLTANDAVADDDFLRINGTEVEGLTAAETRTALNVEDGADVTDTANVTAAGALMDSELTSIADVKALDQSVVQSASPTFASLTLTGDLTVTGARVEQQVTNLAVEDQFITINSGASAQDAGIFFEGQGASFGWDESENRFALDFTGGNASQTTITSDAYVAAVAVADDDANYQKDGNLFVNDSGEAFIYVSS